MDNCVSAAKKVAGLFAFVKILCNNTIQYNTIQYNTIQYNTIQYNTIQYNNVTIPIKRYTKP